VGQNQTLERRLRAGRKRAKPGGKKDIHLFVDLKKPMRRTLVNLRCRKGFKEKELNADRSEIIVCHHGRGPYFRLPSAMILRETILY